MVVGPALVLADQTPDIAVSPAPPVEAGPMHRGCMEAMAIMQLTAIRNAADLSRLHKEISDYPRVLPHLTTHPGMDRNPTDLTAEMIAEGNSDKVAQEADQGTWTLMFQITMTVAVTAAMIARETLASMARIQMPIGVRLVDVITVGILHREEGAAVPATETAVEGRDMMPSEFLLNAFYLANPCG